ncbi:MAG TPA: LapA family protein [Conexibacter sp.]
MVPQPTQDGDVAGSSARSRRERARLIAIGILAVLATLFAVLNFDQVKVHLLFDTVKLPLVVVIAVCLLVGFVIGVLATRRSAKRAGRAG